jgi:hypothetical protein
MIITVSEIDYLERPSVKLSGYNTSSSLGCFLDLFINATSDGQPQR